MQAQRDISRITMMVIEESININVSQDVIFNIYRDIERWHIWDPDTKSSHLDGPFEVGSEGKLVPTKGSAIAIKMTEMVPNECFTVEGGIPLFHMVFEHELIDQGQSTKVIHRVKFSGLLNFILGRIVGSQVREGLPKTMMSLKKFAEAQANVVE